MCLRVSIRMNPVSRRSGRSSAGAAGVHVARTVHRSKSLYNQVMQQFFSRRMLCAVGVSVTACLASLVAQSPPAQQTPAQPPKQQPPAGTQPREVIRRALDIITTDVMVRDNSGQFVADLKKDEFEVYEDGVKQDVQSFVLVHGGRTYNQTVPTAPKQ